MPLFKNQPRRTARIRQPLFIKTSFLKFLPLLLLPLIFILFNSLFRFRNLSCSTPQGECPQKINSLLEQYRHQSLLFFNRQQLIDQISQEYVLEDYSIKLSLPASLNLEIDLAQALAVDVFLVSQDPSFSFQATQSAVFNPPLFDLDRFLASQSSQPYLLEPFGRLHPGQEQDSEVKIIFNRKPSTEQLANFYSLYQQTKQLYPLQKNYLFNTNYFLQVENLPDIIISISSELSDSISALQSLPSLSTIKPGASLIDLRFEHPVIR